MIREKYNIIIKYPDDAVIWVQNEFSYRYVSFIKIKMAYKFKIRESDSVQFST